MNTATDNVKSVVSQISSLPTLPRVVQRVVALLEDPDTSPACLARTISSDSSLVSKILKVANSAYYGLSRKVSTITQATVILGFNTIKNLVLTTSVFTVFNGNNKSNRFDHEGFWSHSLGCATASKIISKQIRLGPPEEAFLAGLLHDIGKIVLDQFLHDQFEKVLDLVEDQKLRIRDAEKVILGADHSEIGAWLCDKWNFPEHLQESVAFHHSPAAANSKMVALVHIADALAHKENIGNGVDNLEREIDPGSLELLNIEAKDLEEMTKYFQDEFNKASIFLELMNGRSTNLEVNPMG